jgi:integral membrane protein
MNTPASDSPPEGSPPDNAFLKKVRLLGFIEGVSTLVLFGLAMPLKYLAGMPMAVRIAGSVHGFLFVLLCIVLAMAITRIPISKSLALAGMFAAILPFGPFVYDRWLAPETQS